MDAPGHASRRTGSTDITIIVRDINDNRPEFPNAPYVGYVTENQEPGASVIMMSAIDNDDPNEGGNAKMTYELIYDADGVFEIDTNSGLIRTTTKLDREAKDVYMVKVGAKDKGKPRQEGKVSTIHSSSFRKQIKCKGLNVHGIFNFSFVLEQKR